MYRVASKIRVSGLWLKAFYGVGTQSDGKVRIEAVQKQMMRPVLVEEREIRYDVCSKLREASRIRLALARPLSEENFSAPLMSSR
jgi:hypothetical protein